MKKNILLLPIIGILLSCSGETKQTAEMIDVSDAQTETIEQYSQSLDNVIYSAEEEIDTVQNEIDKLLNEI